jgi:uncharacterized protein YciI
MYFLLIYDLVDEYLERRPEFRPDHLALAQAALARGELKLAGALDDPVDRAVLVFEGDDERVAAQFAEQDPYVKNGLVKSWKVRKWTVVIGDGITPPTPS